MKHLLLILALTFFTGSIQAQIFKRLGDKIERKVNQRIERKTNKAIDKGLDKMEGSIENIGKNSEQTQPEGNTAKEQNNKSATSNREKMNTTAPAVYSKFDFVPGDKVLFYDDFSADQVGDFPSKWNTNGSGEVVTVENSRTKYFYLKGGALYLPMLKNALPEEYTIEFDLKTSGLDKKISSTTFLDIMLDESGTFQKGHNRAVASLSFCQFISNGLELVSYGGNMGTIRNTVKEDYRKAMATGAHISIAVNKRRFRLWINENKLVDVPTFMPPGASHLKLYLRGFGTDFKQMKVLIGNMKIAAGGLDLRNELVSKGRWTTTGILFNVNSSGIRPQSYGVLKEIATVLKDNPEIKVKIIGHTDSDGSEATNLKLSKERAVAVKSFLTKKLGIEDSRMTTGGKGESDPVADNNTTEGKAQNRRVEFIKL